MKTTEEVFEAHIEAFEDGMDAIVSNFTEESVIISQKNIYKGLGGVREYFTKFLDNVPEGLWDSFEITRKIIEKDIVYLTWEAPPWVLLATDTFVIRDGKILYQTVASHKVSTELA